MVVNDSLLFEQAAQELLSHVGHKLNIICEGGDAPPETVGVVCEDCQTALLDFARNLRHRDTRTRIA